MARIKIYTVQITEPASWYINKVGEKYEARLSLRDFTSPDGNAIPSFKVNQSPFFYINPLHCKIVDEKTIDLCQKN